MAYVQANTTIVSTTAKSAELLTFIDTQIVAAGWTLHDTISSTKKVYKSNGEDATFTYCYILLDASRNTTNLYFCAYGFWNATTHAGLIPAYGDYYIASTTAKKYHFIGDKTFFSVIEQTAYIWLFVGFVPQVFYNPRATVTSSVTSGSNKTINVNAITDFQSGKYYYIFDPSNGTIEKIQITGISSATAVIVASLTNGYSSNSVIAISPFNFFGHNYTNGYTYDTPIVYFVLTTTADIDNNYDLIPELTLSTNTTNIYQSSMLCNAACRMTTDATVYGGTDVISGNLQKGIYPNIVHAPAPEATNVYTVKMSPEKNGQCTSISTTTLITDSTQAWTINEFLDKIFIVRVGTGEGQIRKITSNTSTTITLSTILTTVLDTTSIFEIVERCYIPMRNISGYTQNAQAFSITDYNHPVA